MFGQTNPFGQPSSGPFNSQFGQTNTGISNQFAPNPFGSPNPFNSQTGGSIFGGTSTGVFGAAQSSSSLGSTAFGASATPAFGSSMPSFGATSTPAFGSSSSSFGGSSVFGQKPAFGFGSSPQSSPFGSTFQASQPAFGSTLFGASNQPSFGASSIPAFGSTSTPTFGATSSPGFGTTSTPVFGASTPAFGSTASPTFGSTGSAFGVSGAPIFGSGGAFGASSTPGFGVSSAPAFGSNSTSAFGAPSTSAFGASNTPAFGSAPSFNFGSSSAFGQSSSAFGSSLFGTTASPFGGQSSALGAQATTPTFGGQQRGGSRATPYTPTTEVDGTSVSQPAGKLESISAMHVYKEKSHEELRWEDYQLGDKGGPNPTGQSPSGFGFPTSTMQSNPFTSSPTFGQTSSNLFSSASSNPFAPSTSPFGTSSSPTFNVSPFAAASKANPFGSTSSASSSLFGTSTSGFGSSISPSIFGTSSSSAFGSSPSLFGSASAQATTSAFSTGLYGNTQSSPLFQSTTPSFGLTTSAFGQSTTPPFSQSNLFNTTSTGFGGNLFSSTPTLLPSGNNGGFNQTTTSLATPFQLTQPAQTSSGFGFGNFGQTQAVATSGFGGSSIIFGQSTFGQMPAGNGTAAAQPAPITNPYGTLPVMPQMSIGRVGTSPSIQYGISSMPVIEKQAPVRLLSMLTSRHFSQRRVRLPARKYHPNNDGSKVPFFSNEEETPSTPKADAVFIARENPRALVILPREPRLLRANVEKTPLTEKTSNPVHANEYPVENGLGKELNHFAKPNQKPNGVPNDHPAKKVDSHLSLTGNRAGEAAIVYEHGADIEALMPKLRRSDYYTEPRIQEIAAKERAEPGFSSRVKNFLVGRHGYGKIKFLGETDVRRLDLESLIQFNNREVTVYMDDSKKPPPGQGLNKTAEVTLLNIKCFNKKTEQQYTEGPKIERYKELLKRKAEEQGAEFLSYNAIEGEWKFRVNHFSTYKLGNEHDSETDSC